MTLPLAAVLSLLLGYLLGAIPFGVIAGKLKGVDVRKVGSGKTGTANVTRSLGMRIGLLVMALDIGKGALAVVLGKALGDNTVAPVLSGIAAVVGHNWSVFIGFGGGRGVSTGVGGLLALAPLAGLAAALAAFSTMGISRYVSLGSILGTIVGALVLVALVLVDRYVWHYTIYGLVVAPLIIYQHRDNIGRLLRGEERRLGQKAQPLPSNQVSGAG